MEDRRRGAHRTSLVVVARLADAGLIAALTDKSITYSASRRPEEHDRDSGRRQDQRVKEERAHELAQPVELLLRGAS